MKKFKILVFPCGSEIGLELQRSLNHLKEIELWGGNSVDDHGRFVYKNYIPDIPYVTDANFTVALKEIVSTHQFDAIYPATDMAISTIKKEEELLGCKVIASKSETTEICLNKEKTYSRFKEILNTPRVLDQKSIEYPCFAKPKVGYGSRGAKKITNDTQLTAHLTEFIDCIITEWLPGDEYTVDCFTNFSGALLIVLPRTRSRILNGISVHTKSISNNKDEFIQLAQRINNEIKLDGSWFFQVKRNGKGELVLLEIASRIGGSSSLWKLAGINLPLLSILNAFEFPIQIQATNISIEMDRSLNNAYKIDFSYTRLYIDYDDCILVSGKLNLNAIQLIYQCINNGIKVILVTKHADDVHASLTSFRINNLFDEIIHLPKESKKSTVIPKGPYLFIDDSFSERKDVAEHCGILTLGVESIACLIHE